MTTIADNLARVRDRIADAASRYGRTPGDIRLLAVSKTKPVTDVEAAIAAGQHAFGENYLQDALPKVVALPDEEWHFIGHIQSNKTRDIAASFDWVHTVASEKVARRLSTQRPAGKAPMKILIQVNISAEEGKSGVAPAEVASLAAFCAACENLAPVGLMAIPEATGDEGAQRAVFAKLASLRASVATESGIAGFNELSMGMSRDLEAAVAEGATWLRIGTDIFGTRD